MAIQEEVTTESAEDRLKKRAEATDVEAEKFSGDAPQGEEGNLPPKLDVALYEPGNTPDGGITRPLTDEEAADEAPSENVQPKDEVFIPPPFINEYTEVYHYMRTVGTISNPQFGILAGAELDAEVNSILKGGYGIIDVLAAGYSPEGDRILFIFGKREGEQEYTEMHFVKRVLGIGEGAITGFNADVWVNYQIEQEGYRIFKTLLNGSPPEGIVILWILVR